ncbi:MAG: glycosyltransferase family 2 protein [Bryobacteraceae bacterium]
MSSISVKSLNYTPDIRKAEAAFASGDVEALSGELTALFPHDPDLHRVGDLVRGALGAPTQKLALSGTAALFFENIARTKQLLGSPGPDPCHQYRMLVGAGFDFIANLDGIPGWTIPQFLNFLVIGQIRPTRHAAVVGTMRDDGIYALEWIAYYLALGFEHIFIYTNDNADGSEALLRVLAERKIITLIESETSGEVGPEAKAYEHSLQFLHHLRDFEWVFYADSDEYFVPASRFGNSVLKVLAMLEEKFPDRLPSAICYPWLWFISDMAFAREPGLLIERFQHARHHWITKSLVRPRDIVSMRHEHFPDVKHGGFLVDSALAPLPFDVRDQWKGHNPQYAGGRINHYWPKSFEEFAIKKARGQAIKLKENLYDRPFELFFAWNGYASKDNHYPISPVILQRVRKKIEALKEIEGVSALADRIDRGFSALLRHYYSGRHDLRRLYARHNTEPTQM